VTFALVGTVTFAADFALFNLALNAGFTVGEANLTSTTFAALVGYVGHLKLTYRSNGASANAENVAKFILLGLISIALNQFLILSMIWLSEDPSRVVINIFKVASVLVTAVLRFFVMDRFIFRTANKLPAR